MSQITQQQQASWTTLTSKTYAEQAVWFLNGFWDEGLAAEAENVWKWVELFGQLDQERRAGGSELDEFWSHKFLESLGETLTVIALRERLRAIDVDNNKRMSLIEYLIFRYNKSINAVLEADQGQNKAEVEAAQAKVNSAQAAVEEVVRRLDEQRAAAAAAKRDADAAAETAAAAAAAEAEATRTADAAKEAAEAARAAAAEADAVAAPYRAAVAENDAALRELQAQEEEFNSKKAELERASTTGGLVQRTRAANELEQLKAEDPLPLRRAKINQQATLRKMEKASPPRFSSPAKANEVAQASDAAAAEAEAAAEHARAERARADEAAAEAARSAEAAEEAQRQVEQAVAEAEAQLREAVEYLEAVKKKGGVAHGAIWWMERQIIEKRKYMPKSKAAAK
eukprot:m51a1_g5103 hypothetical protein (399) ;mRNA; r:302401-304203